MWHWLIILGLALLVWRACQPRGDCVIRLRGGQVSVRGRLAAGREPEIERFLTEHFSEVHRLRIDVLYPRGSQRLRLRIAGRLTDGERQLIRNFLTTTL